MQMIKQNSLIYVDKFTEFVRKYMKKRFSIDKTIVHDDIDRIRKLQNETKNKIVVKNADNIIKYLESIIKNTDKNGGISIRYKVTEDGVSTMPLEVKKIPIFNICFTNYSSSKDKRCVTLNYRELADCLAFDLAYMEYYDTLDEIESTLEDIGVVNTYPSSIVRQLAGDARYEVVSGLKVSSTPYKSVDGKAYTDYFGKKLGKCEFYRDMVDSSVKKTMALITFGILSDIDESGINAEVSAIYDESIELLIDKSITKDDIVENIDLSVVLRLFGRKFEFNPSIEIY